MSGSNKPQSSDTPTQPSAALTAEPEDFDIDLSLLEDSLRLTPWQRLVENDRALALVRMFEQAGARHDGEP
jgi:hypothetical protein